eukprot:jgi/Botrbrau1/19505/Bobra.0035s0006.1
MALLSWFGDSDVTSKLSEHATQNGAVDCLQAHPKCATELDFMTSGSAVKSCWAGVLGSTFVAYQATAAAQLECLKYLLDLDPGLVQLPLLQKAAHGWVCSIQAKADDGASVACLEFLRRAGCQWSAEGHELVFALGRPQVVRYCLENMEIFPWDMVTWRCSRCSLECMQLLYDAGYEQHRRQLPWGHPALQAVGWADTPPVHSDVLPRLRLAVRWSGAPDARLFDMVAVVRAGVDVLRYVRELGAPFSIKATNAAAGDGMLAELQYMLEKGAPWDASTFEQAIWPGVSVPCLRCLLQHARTAGHPERYPAASRKSLCSERQTVEGPAGSKPGSAAVCVQSHGSRVGRPPAGVHGPRSGILGPT